MEIVIEPYSPSRESIKLIEDCIEAMRPDVEELGDWHDSYITNHINRIAFDLEIVKDNTSVGDKILEYGSVPPILTTALNRLNYSVSGIDIAPERYGSYLSKRGIEVQKCNVETEVLPERSNTYDVVLFFEIFEHLRINPIFTMKEARRVLKPGGVLMLSTPNLKSYEGLINFFFRNRCYSCTGDIYSEFDKLEKIGHMGHVREYTTKEITDFLHHLRFEIVRIAYRGSYSGRLSKLLIRQFPKLRPFVTYLAKNGNFEQVER
jgi:SAM-dependent methyltransferase